MTTPEFVAALFRSDTYPHACGDVRLIETHISWVFLTGEYAYKIKKPVDFKFVDFSTAELRKHFCEEEVRCNLAFAPELYLGVVTVNLDRAGRYRIDGVGEVVETAVKMREFPQAWQLDNLLAAGGLDVDTMARFGTDLAERHARLPRLDGEPDEVDARVLKPALDNFRTLTPLAAAAPHHQLLDRLEADSLRAFEQLRARFVQRLENGFIRECHGDLHLSNLMLTDDGVRAFDCLEFNPNLRWIDTLSDVAFLFMDCVVRSRNDLGYAFLDGYLTGSADYDGVVLSPFFQAYRSMVRAKVAALQLEERPLEGDDALKSRLSMHIRWAHDRLHRPPGMLLLMSGFSGSGKSHVAKRLAMRLPAVRVRSDVLRKARAGLEPLARSDSPVDSGLYTSDQTRTVYEDMLRICMDLLRTGESVIADATFLDRDQRRAYQRAASDHGVRCVVVRCHASNARLERRVRERAMSGDDVSEAGLEVLRGQLSRFVPITADESYLEIATDAPLDLENLERRICALFDDQAAFGGEPSGRN